METTERGRLGSAVSWLSLCFCLSCAIGVRTPALLCDLSDACAAALALASGRAAQLFLVMVGGYLCVCVRLRQRADRQQVQRVRCRIVTGQGLAFLRMRTHTGAAVRGAAFCSEPQPATSGQRARGRAGLAVAPLAPSLVAALTWLRIERRRFAARQGRRQNRLSRAKLAHAELASHIRRYGETVSRASLG